MVFETVFKSYSCGFFSETISTSSGTPCSIMSIPILFAVGKINCRASGKTMRPFPADKAPNPPSLLSMVTGKKRQ